MSARLRSNLEKGYGPLVLRALTSTVVISGVAGLIVVVRAGGWRWQECGRVLLRHWEVGLAIFFGLVIWDGWFERRRRSESKRSL